MVAQVTKNWTIAQIINEHPKGEEIIKKYIGTNCFACSQSLEKKISECMEDGHGLSCQTILDELNRN